eukprot:CAMPEP_0119411472 /NCGR_PEP_ID=MMETSP1335-20130426/4216_1 /TAXON_ID=259385 /ORGANISM="Chrysoculter rhomboideus, Strain RCC1486" /LENGTH=50 /DNA_ID=CAMNT_0007436119 /DNA_START=651 /DNA_END=799 /DNA_ORIENTATION=-
MSAPAPALRLSASCAPGATTALCGATMAVSVGWPMPRAGAPPGCAPAGIP